MGRWLRPDDEADSLWAVDPAALRARGIRGVILDLDNTMVPWGASQVPDGLEPWIGAARAVGLELCIVTNNPGPRVARLIASLRLPAVVNTWWRGKPRRGALRQAIEIMGTTPATTALVGDQLFTDVLGGNRLGLHTILVPPQTDRDFPLTRVVRFAERFILRAQRRGPASGRGIGRPL